LSFSSPIERLEIRRYNKAAILRYDWRNNAVVIVHNLAPAPLEIRLDVKSGPVEERDLISLLSESRLDNATSTGRLMFVIIGAVGQAERENMLER
jgi:hypothetical protein